MLFQAGLVALGATLAAAVQPLEVKGNYFVNSDTGNRFQIVGAAYQPGGSSAYNPDLGKDPLSDKDTCLRDAAILQVLGVNAIRVYNLDPNLNHDECASIFNAAGMYMLLDVNSPLVGESINSGEPWTSYYAAYLNRTFAVVEAFKSYPNTLLFFAGNEVIWDVHAGTIVPPYMRAVTRDIKNYISKHSDRKIPVGYSAADVREILFDSWEYLQCSEDGTTDDPSRVDVFALNSYSWCGDATFKSSTYEDLVEGFQNSSVPLFFSEYGCNTPSPRVFTEVPTIYGPQMTGVFSGGVVYEYSQEENNFGLVNISSDGSVTLRTDYNTLKAQYAGLNFTDIEGAKPPSGDSPSPPKCSAKLITGKEDFTTNFTLPAVPPGAQDIIDDGVSPKPSGKLVTISDWTVKQTVRNADGSTIQGLAVKPLDDDSINAPGSNTATGLQTGTATAAATATGTSSSTSTPSSSQNAAPGFSPSGSGMPVSTIIAIAFSTVIGSLILAC
ncbi:1,3-beta-glucanosyltransferase [Pleurostoma richardsiae]|uniref:1,3-beta-glucanosyltransferase n=1 Tax=Pleurostoma richardsiae TaxID=41990 RepID=A0AA38VLH5_9PEZI|nr:1,3-beta-glucanosyltransferase [Pleurostoma richardsiae]